MAVKKRSTSQEEENPYGLNEVDDFAAKNERILLENSSLNRQGDNLDDDHIDDDDEEEVMSLSGESDSEEDEEDEEDAKLDGEKAYRQVFGRNLRDDQRPLEDGELEAEEGMLDENAWGSTKNEYYGADDLDDDEAAKEIEKEALRQQKKHLQELNMADYLDDEIEEEWVKSAKEFDVSEFQSSTNQKKANVSFKDVHNMDSESKKEYFKTMLPEYLPLCKEFTELTETMNELKSSKDSEFTKIKSMALSTYLGAIAAYLGILSHEFNNNEEFTTMKDHPVMEAILTSKEVWRQASELPNDFDNDDEVAEQEQVSDEDVGDIEELDEDVLQNISADNSDKDKNMQSGSEEDEDEADLDDFEEYVGQSRVERNSTKETNEEVADDFVESEMADVDAQEKKKRKRSLRFYTAKIDQQAHKKTDRFTGDDDIPYKERLYERQQRLLEEARKRGLHDKNGADLDDKDYDSQEEAVSYSVKGQASNDYYNQIQKGREQKKQNRKDAHKTAIIAAREGKLAEAIEAVGEDGKRAINYQILKNKGLTPKRKKDNRNSRVKKRKKYEKAQKKLKSVRAVYSGGQSGVYEGEKTGIKKNLTRSVKFKN
ncbi:something about silencing protein 10 [Monosporozyma unispora]|nr:something about silencing protein 10 [Kazachstania unispora]